MLDSPQKRIAALALLGFLAALVVGSVWMAVDDGFGGRYFQRAWAKAAFGGNSRWFDLHDWLVRYGLWGSLASAAFILLFDRGRAAYLRIRAWVRGAQAE